MDPRYISKSLNGHLDKIWKQLEQQNWLEVGSTWAPKAAVSRDCRFVGQFVATLESTWYSTSPQLWPKSHRMACQNGSELTTKAAVSRDCRFVDQLVPILEPTWSQFKSLWHQCCAKLGPDCLQIGSKYLFCTL